jgi:hypothetical protein
MLIHSSAKDPFVHKTEHMLDLTVEAQIRSFLEKSF